MTVVTKKICEILTELKAVYTDKRKREVDIDVVKNKDGK